MCWGVVAFIVMTMILWLGGAFLAGAAESAPNDVNLCTEKGSGDNEDPTIPITNDNLFVWYLENTGLFVFLMIFSSCLCCGAYVVLCCEGRFHRYIKYCGLCGFCYVSCSFALLVMWVILGTYLLGLMRADAVAESVCRNVSIYVTFIYAYIVVFVIVCIIAIIWKLHEVATSLQSKSRTRSK